jgi:hypothetical protein
MKRLFSIILVTLLTTSFAMADCKQVYKKQKIKVATDSVLSTASGLSLTGGGVGTFYLGAVVGILASSNGIIIAGSVAGGAITTGGLIVSIKGIKNGIDFVRKVKAYKLIKQSYVGAGKFLNKLAEDLSEDLNRDITTAQIAAIVIDGDQSKRYCETKKSLFGIKKIKADLAANL